MLDLDVASEVYQEVERLISKIAYEVSTKFHYDYDDLLSRAQLFYCPLSAAYDHTRGMKFSSFMAMAMKRRLNQYAQSKLYRKDARNRFTIPLPRSFNFTSMSSEDFRYEDGIESEERAEHQEAHDLCPGLTQEHKDVLRILLNAPAYIRGAICYDADRTEFPPVLRKWLINQGLDPEVVDESYLIIKKQLGRR